MDSAFGRKAIHLHDSFEKNALGRNVDDGPPSPRRAVGFDALGHEKLDERDVAGGDRGDQRPMPLAIHHVSPRAREEQLTGGPQVSAVHGAQERRLVHGAECEERRANSSTGGCAEHHHW